MLEVRPRPATATRYHLEIYHEDTHIGDYETSIKKNIARKEKEIARCADFLLDIYAKYGKFVVRWTEDRKDIREYQEEGNNPAHPIEPLGVVVPKKCWDWA